MADGQRNRANFRKSFKKTIVLDFNRGFTEGVVYRRSDLSDSIMKRERITGDGLSYSSQFLMMQLRR